MIRREASPPIRQEASPPKRQLEARQPREPSSSSSAPSSSAHLDLAAVKNMAEDIKALAQEALQNPKALNVYQKLLPYAVRLSRWHDDQRNRNRGDALSRAGAREPIAHIFCVQEFSFQHEPWSQSTDSKGWDAVGAAMMRIFGFKENKPKVEFVRKMWNSALGCKQCYMGYLRGRARLETA